MGSLDTGPKIKRADMGRRQCWLRAAVRGIHLLHPGFNAPWGTVAFKSNRMLLCASCLDLRGGGVVIPSVNWCVFEFERVTAVCLREVLNL